jgi:(p)ppGpp synthase/HD superfamily hydrolase
MDSLLASQSIPPDFLRQLPRTQRALGFAVKRHAGQRRELDDAPFMTHPLEVATLLYETGYPDHVVAAGVLHDVLEDTDTKPAELERRFGSEVAALVTDVTDDPRIENHAERKAALRSQVAQAGDEALAIFAADKVSKAREVRLRASRGRLDDRSRGKIDHYEKSLAMLTQLIPDHELVAQLRMELEALHALPADGV